MGTPFGQGATRGAMATSEQSWDGRHCTARVIERSSAPLPPLAQVMVCLPVTVTA